MNRRSRPALRTRTHTSTPTFTRRRLIHSSTQKSPSSADALTHVRQLKKADGGGIWLCGGGRLAASLVAEMDRLVLKVNPITVGEGMPLFNSTFEPRAWRLDSTHVFDLGVVLLEYSQAR